MRRSILKRDYAHRRTPYIIRSLDHSDALFLLNVNEKTDRLALINRNERTQVEQMLTWATERRVALVLDVGANFGLYAITLARRLPSTRVIAFEPAESSRSRLAVNVLINQIDNIEIMACAASDTDHKMPFVNKIAGHSGLSRIKDDRLLNKPDKGEGKYHAADWQETTVETRKIDSIIQVSSRDIAVKLDTEGHECEVLQGMGKLLKNNNCYLQVEISLKLPENRRWIASFMQDLDYELRG